MYVLRLPEPLASRNFRLLLACDATSILGTAVVLVAVPFAVLAIGGSGADVGYVAASAGASSWPATPAAPFSGDWR
jgi:hypothetical protein